MTSRDPKQRFGVVDLSGRKSRDVQRRDEWLISIDPDNPALFNRERQLAMFQRQRRFAEQLAAPAVQCGYVGTIVSGDLLPLVDRRDYLVGDGVSLRRHPQLDFQKLDDRRAV